MINKILDIIFPPTCGMCGKIGKKWICGKCYRKIKKDLSLKKIQLKKNLYVNYIFIYKGQLREKLLDYKFNDNSYLYRMFLEIILKDNDIRELIQNSDYIIPVPMFINNKKKRGYNQNELICEGISKNLNIVYDKNILVKTKSNKTQSLLDETERKINVKDVFEVKNSEIIRNKNILLFDDICTTSATIRECYKILKKYSNKITILVLAKSNYKKG